MAVCLGKADLIIKFNNRIISGILTIIAAPGISKPSHLQTLLRTQ